jgi:hypothetical protein
VVNVSEYDNTLVSDEYLNSFFERVQIRSVPSKFKWVRADDISAFFRGTYGAIEVGVMAAQDSRVDEPHEVGPILIGPFWPTGDFDRDVDMFLDLMRHWAVHEMYEHTRIDGELLRDPHEVDEDGYFLGKEIVDAYHEKWDPMLEEAFA